MPEVTTRSRDDFPLWVGMVFIFNLIVGTGALTLPSVFAKAGWVLGTMLIVILAFFSYITLTFIIECMACGNAILHVRRLQMLKRLRRALTTDEDSTAENNEEPNNDDEEEFEGNAENTPLFVQRTGYYSLDDKIELGELATMFFSKVGVICFYFCISIYLYGDLSIYMAAVAKSITDILCNSSSDNSTSTLLLEANSNGTELCWNGMEKFHLYQINLIAFVIILGPFVFFNVQKTKYIQFLTVIFRWAAFSIMIIIALCRFANHTADGHPPQADFSQVSNLFGACIYSFMCHHSAPSLIAPIKQKQHLKFALSVDYIWIGGFYLLLALTGAFAFSNLYDLYTLNFIPSSAEEGFTVLKFVEYFLGLFPVFTLSASFPIIAITLRNNLQILFLDMSQIDTYGIALRRLVFPLLAIIPPLIVTLNTENIHSLVKFTGSYAGTGIQYIIPVALIYFARRECVGILGPRIVNEYQSPFKSNWWLISIIAWTILCVCLVSMNFFTDDF